MRCKSEAWFLRQDRRRRDQFSNRQLFSEKVVAKSSKLCAKVVETFETNSSNLFTQKVDFGKSRQSFGLKKVEFVRKSSKLFAKAVKTFCQSRQNFFARTRRICAEIVKTF
jgi:hypothetical protein